MIKLPKYIWGGLSVFAALVIITIVDTPISTGVTVTGYVVSSGAAMGSKYAKPNEMVTIELSNGVTIYENNIGYSKGQSVEYHQYKTKFLGRVKYHK